MKLCYCPLFDMNFKNAPYSFASFSRQFVSLLSMNNCKRYSKYLNYGISIGMRVGSPGPSDGGWTAKGDGGFPTLKS